MVSLVATHSIDRHFLHEPENFLDTGIRLEIIARAKDGDGRAKGFVFVSTTQLCKAILTLHFVPAGRGTIAGYDHSIFACFLRSWVLAHACTCFGDSKDVWYKSFKQVHRDIRSSHQENRNSR